MAKSDDDFPLPKTRGRPPSELPASSRISMERSFARVENFEPSPEQERVKARFLRRLEDKSHLYDMAKAVSTPAVLVDLAGTKKILDWAKQDEFLEWFMDDNFFEDSVLAMRGRALKVIREIMDSDVAQDSDKLKATKMIMELSDSFPGRKQEIRFIDERLNKMSADQVAAEKQQLLEELGEVPSLPAPTPVLEKVIDAEDDEEE